jgi:lysophospholipase L1-like esterase
VSAELSLRRRIAFSLLLGAFVLLVIEVTCQLFYRITAGDFLFRRTGAPIFEEDPTRCYRLKSNLVYEHRTNEFEIAIYTNSQGMRTDASRQDVAPSKPSGAYRILFLGPSFTFGWGNEFEEAYPTLIGEGLRATGRQVEIVNLGTPAQGIEAQLCWLEQEGPRLAPDMVVQTVYGDRVPTVVGECPARLDCPVIEAGQLYTVAPSLARKLIAHAKNLGIVFYGYYAYQWALGIAPAGEAGTGKELHGERALQRGDGELLARDFERYERTIARNLGEHVEVVFLFVPMSFVVHPGDAPRWSHVLEPDPLGARARIQADLAALRALGHVIVDTTPALIERGTDERLFYWLDIHLNPAGNRVVAETALPVLSERIRAAASPSP